MRPARPPDAEEKSGRPARAPWSRHWRPLAALVALLVLIYVVAAATVLPSWIVSLSARPKADDNTLLNAVTNTRGALLGLLAPLAVVVGGVAALLNFRETQRQNRATLRVQERGQVTERFTKAIEQLGQAGSDKLDVRIGAVYALEQIAQDSDELHWPIMEVLTAYLREHARTRPDVASTNEASTDGGGERAPADVQAIATVIRRRRWWQDPPPDHPDDEEDGSDRRGLDLRQVDLRQVEWAKAALEGAILIEAHLQHADLIQAKLKDAILRGAHLEGARLDWAELDRACLEGAQLQEAILAGASLRGANLRGAALQRAVLAGPRLGTRRRTKLDGADLSGADLTDVMGLTWPELEHTIGDKATILPDYLLAEEPPSGHRWGAILSGNR